MSERGELLNDADFRRLLQRRSRLRWWLAGFLTAAYLGYGLAGIYTPALLAKSLPNSSITLSIALGYGIIALGIACSIGYVWQVNKIIAPLQKKIAGEWR
ncbi:MAG TPA: DUF485 domain-containing protein [Woeseiaceae bacterium]|nr:DUF485 domain-containing protein [Woeseiaceae bacterium]